jgi:hypothetical protein
MGGAPGEERAQTVAVSRTTGKSFGGMGARGDPGADVFVRWR